MKLILALAAIAVVVLAIIIFWVLKRKAKKSRPDTVNVKTRAESAALKSARNASPAPEPAMSGQPETPVRSESPLRPEPMVKESMGQDKQPVKVEPEMHLQAEMPVTQEHPPVEVAPATAARVVYLGAVSDSSSAAKQACVPEDSVLRRHYLSTRQAEKLAITNPYPTDSILRRHYQNMLALLLNDGGCAKERAEAPIPELATVVAAKLAVPQDSVLRRHFLTQLRTEIEQRLFPKPQDSILKRHYENLVNTKMKENLPECLH